MSFAKTLALFGFLTCAVPAVISGVTPAHAETTRNLAQEEANRKIVVDFYNRFFNEHDIECASAVVVDDYKQHNPNVPNGKAPLVEYFTTYFKENPQSRARIVRSVAQDDLVWLHLHSTKEPGDTGRAIVDIFRVTDGKITEHWDVVQLVPEKSANDNTMF